jgi:hypothetical protein
MHVSIISCCLIHHAIQTKSVTHRTQQYIATIYDRFITRGVHEHHYIYVPSEWFYAQTLLVT